MNILLLANHLDVGGISSYLLTLAGGLTQRGHNVYLACEGGSLVHRFTAGGNRGFVAVPTRTKGEFNPLRLYKSMRILRRLVKEKGIDIVHSNTRVTQVLGELLAGSTDACHVSTCHGFFKKRLLRRIFPCWGKETIAISRQVADHLVRDLGVHEKNIEVIYNGIDLARFSGAALAARQSFRQLLGLGEKPLVGIIARLSDVKGHCYLIQAMPRVVRRFPEAKLLIIGEGKTESSLREQVRSLGIEQSVIFMPTAEDTAAALAAMDVFVLPSLQEGLGLSLMEAMASGLAVVGSAVGGIQDLLRQGENGLLVQRADADALATEIIGLLSDGEKRRRLGSAARKSMQEKFSQERMCLETERVYLKCVNKEN